MEDFDYSNKRIRDKTRSEMTVGDELTMAAVSTAVMVGVSAVFIASVAAADRIQAYRKARKHRKIEKLKSQIRTM